MDDTCYFRHNNVVYACSLYPFYMVEEEYISLALCHITGHQNNLHGIYNIWVVLVANKCLHHQYMQTDWGHQFGRQLAVGLPSWLGENVAVLGGYVGGMWSVVGGGQLAIFPAGNFWP